MTESNELIEELTSYMVQPQAMYTHKWAKNDVVIWDNRCSFHKAAGDYPPEEDRIHWRVSIRDVPGTSRIAHDEAAMTEICKTVGCAVARS